MIVRPKEQSSTRYLRYLMECFVTVSYTHLSIMAKTIFEQMDGTYTMQGDYYLPDLTLPAEEERPTGVWAQRRLRYLKQHHKILYYNLLTSGKLHSHLADVEEEAQELFFRLVKEYAEQEGCLLYTSRCV